MLPQVPARQWVLSLPHALRYLFAFDHELCRAALAIFTRTLLSFQRRRARRAGLRGGRSGSVTVIQRFAAGLRLNIHFHTLVFAGVFVEGDDGQLRFHALPPPTDEEVGRLATTVRVRILRLLGRRGLGDGDGVADDEAVEPSSPALAALAGAAVRGVQALGRGAGALVRRLGSDPHAPWVSSRADLHAHVEGFDLHAAVSIAADDRAGRERLCRYLLRPAIAQDRLELQADGRVRVELRSAWSDGTTHLLFEPLELIGRLASLIPRPHTKLLIYHGVLAPHASWRARVVAYGSHGSATPIAATPTVTEPGAAEQTEPPASDASMLAGDATAVGGTAERRGGGNRSWAELMHRAFGIDVLACPGCGGRMRLIATIMSASVIRAILDHVGLGRNRASAPGFSRAPPGEVAWPAADDWS